MFFSLVKHQCCTNKCTHNYNMSDVTTMYLQCTLYLFKSELFLHSHSICSTPNKREKTASTEGNPPNFLFYTTHFLIWFFFFFYRCACRTWPMHPTVKTMKTRQWCVTISLGYQRCPLMLTVDKVRKEQVCLQQRYKRFSSFNRDYLQFG